MSNMARVFKSNARYMSYPTRGFGLISFAMHRCIIPVKGNEKKIKFIEEELVSDPRLGIYIDEKEKEVDLANVANVSQMKNEEILHLLRTQASKLPESESATASKIGASSAADLQGKANPAAQRFHPSDVQRALVQNATHGNTVSPDPVIANQDQVGVELQKDPDALAKKLLGK